MGVCPTKPGSLRPRIQQGVAVVGLEPSCLAVFRDEMPDLLPNDEDAKRLAGNCFTLAEFLDRRSAHFVIPKLERKAVVHGHCHQKAVLGMDSEARLLKNMSLDAEVLDDGCCGMAGSFGFEPHKYDVSMKVFDHELRSQVENAAKDTLVVADGFSCRTQIEQGTDRRALHTAELLKMAMDHGPHGVSGDYPERRMEKLPRNDGHAREWITGGIVAGLLVGIWSVFRARCACRSRAATQPRTQAKFVARAVTAGNSRP